jgi:hypothetical protein
VSPELQICVRLKDEYKGAAGRCALAIKSGCASGGIGLRNEGECPDCDEMDVLSASLERAGCL